MVKIYLVQSSAAKQIMSSLFQDMHRIHYSEVARPLKMQLIGCPESHVINQEQRPQSLTSFPSLLFSVPNNSP